MQVRLAEDVTSFEFEIDTLTDESFHERYLRLKRDLGVAVDPGTTSSSSDETPLPMPVERLD